MCQHHRQYKCYFRRSLAYICRNQWQHCRQSIRKHKMSKQLSQQQNSNQIHKQHIYHRSNNNSERMMCIFQFQLQSKYYNWNLRKKRKHLQKHRRCLNRRYIFQRIRKCYKFYSCHQYIRDIEMRQLLEQVNTNYHHMRYMRYRSCNNLRNTCCIGFGQQQHKSCIQYQRTSHIYY